MDSLFGLEANGTTLCQDAYGSAYTSVLLPFGEVVPFRFTIASHQTHEPEPNGRQSHVMVTETGRHIARTIRRLLPNQRTDFSLLKLVKGLSWDGQGLVRRGRPPKVTLDAPTMAEAGEMLRAGGSSSVGTSASSIPPEPSTVRDG